MNVFVAIGLHSYDDSKTLLGVVSTLEKGLQLFQDWQPGARLKSQLCGHDGTTLDILKWSSHQGGWVEIGHLCPLLVDGPLPLSVVPLNNKE